MNPPTEPLHIKALKLFQAGRGVEAEQVCRQALAQNPRDADTLNVMSSMLVAAGRPRDALKAARQAQSFAPDNTTVRIGLGQTLIAAGERDEGIGVLSEVYAREPQRIDAGYGLAVALVQSGRFEDAIPLLERLREKKNAPPHTLLNLGIAYLQSGDRKKGMQCLRRARAAMPHDPHVLLNLGSALLSDDAPGDALDCFRKMAEAVPNAPEPRLQMALAYRDLGDNWRSLQALSKAVELAPDYPYAHLNLASLQLRRGDYVAAMKHATAAVERMPGRYEAIVNLTQAQLACEGSDRAIRTLEENVGLFAGDRQAELRARLIRLHQSAGRFQEARRVFHEMEDGPERVRRLLGLMTVDRSIDLDEIRPEVEQAERNLESFGDDDRALADICFALASFYDRDKDFETASGYLVRANDLRAAEYENAPAAPEQDTERNRAIFSDTVERHPDASESQQFSPIFVVGLPRSGTTLTEQMIGAHPSSSGGGEHPGIGIIARELRSRFDLSAPFPENVPELTVEMLDEVAADYRRMLTAVTGSAARPVDKMPGNFWHIGLILAMFPGARIVHCRRNLASTGLSIYQQNFAGEHPYAYNLNMIEQHARAYLEQSDIWRNLYGDRIRDLWYEDLVASPETEMSGLLDWLELPWDDAVLQYHQGDKSIRTASLWQARQPVYKSSTDKWRKYVPYLPELEALDRLSPERPAQ